MSRKPTPSSWKPGQSGNPRGRKRNGNTAKDIFTILGGPNGREFADQLYALACGVHDDPGIRVKALAIIAPYIWGKPVETVKLDADITANTKVVHEQLK